MSHILKTVFATGEASPGLPSSVTGSRHSRDIRAGVTEGVVTSLLQGDGLGFKSFPKDGRYPWLHTPPQGPGARPSVHPSAVSSGKSVPGLARFFWQAHSSLLSEEAHRAHSRGQCRVTFGAGSPGLQGTLGTAWEDEVWARPRPQWAGWRRIASSWVAGSPCPARCQAHTPGLTICWAALGEVRVHG